MKIDDMMSKKMRTLFIVLVAVAAVVVAAPSTAKDAVSPSDIHSLRTHFKEDLDMEVPDEDLAYLVMGSKSFPFLSGGYHPYNHHHHHDHDGSHDYDSHSHEHYDSHSRERRDIDDESNDEKYVADDETSIPDVQDSVVAIDVEATPNSMRAKSPEVGVNVEATPDSKKAPSPEVAVNVEAIPDSKKAPSPEVAVNVEAIPDSKKAPNPEVAVDMAATPNSMPGSSFKVAVDGVPSAAGMNTHEAMMVLGIPQLSVSSQVAEADLEDEPIVLSSS